jgi:hypothetical protein
MARWRQNTQSLAAFVTLGILPAGCGAVDANGGQVNEADRNAGFFALLDTLATGEAGQALEAQGAQVDRQFERSGQWRFVVPRLAGEGSELLFAPGKPGSVESIALIPPPELRVTERDVQARFGEGRRLPAVPGQGWRMEYRPDDKRIIAVYSSSPDQPTSTLVRISRRVEGH